MKGKTMARFNRLLELKILNSNNRQIKAARARANRNKQVFDKSFWATL